SSSSPDSPSGGNRSSHPPTVDAPSGRHRTGRRDMAGPPALARGRDDALARRPAGPIGPGDPPLDDPALHPARMDDRGARSEPRPTRHLRVRPGTGPSLAGPLGHGPGPRALGSPVQRGSGGAVPPAAHLPAPRPPRPGRGS